MNRRYLILLWGGLLTFYASLSLAAPTTIPSHEALQLSLAQMGYPQGITLQSGQYKSGIHFTLPEDQLVTVGKLKLDLKISQLLAQPGTSLHLQLNNQPLGDIKLNPKNLAKTSYQLNIPSVLITTDNNLNFEVNGNEQYQCQDKQRPESLLTILPTSNLLMDTIHLPLDTQLNDFPKPFFYKKQMASTEVSFAFSSTLIPSQIKAATMLASWLGIQADYRGISFHTIEDKIPPKNGIIIGKSGDKIGGLQLPTTTAPSLKLIDNPANPDYKLLLIIGNNSAQLNDAIWQLIQKDLPKKTNEVQVSKQTIAYSKPYDAPRWIPTNAPVYLKNLTGRQSDITVNGIWHNVIKIWFRAAPDLYLWDNQQFPLDIHYQFPDESWLDAKKSFLSVSLNNHYLRNLSVNKKGLLERLWSKLGRDERQEEAEIPLDPYMIYGDNQLSLYFKITPTDTAPCNVLLDNNIKSRIELGSSIDLSRAYHFSLLPNLSYFVGASFPFSRFADLSHTAILLPEKPSANELTTLFNLAARIGNATGTAITHDQLYFGIPDPHFHNNYLRNKDILAIATSKNAQFNRQLLARTPFQLNSGMFDIRTTTLWQKIVPWIKGYWNLDQKEASRYFSSNQQWRGFISYPSPWSDAHIVVQAIATDDHQLIKLTQDLQTPAINSAIRGDVAIITDGNGVHSFRIAPPFPSGQLPWYMMLIWYASQHSVLLAILAVLMSFLTALGLFRWHKRHSAQRLNME